MGVMKKIAFWRKSSKTSAVVTFLPPEDDQEDEVDEVRSNGSADAAARSGKSLKAAGVGSPKSPAIAAAGSPKSPAVAAARSPRSPAAAAWSPKRPAAPAEAPAALDAREAKVTQGCVGGAVAEAEAPALRAVAARDEGGLPAVKKPPVANAAALPPARGLARTPSPEGEWQEDSQVNFDTPLDQVYKAIGEAFGQVIATSLQSPKWDKRSQALKAVTTVMKGLELQGVAAPPGSTGMLGRGLKLRDRTRCWRVSCRLLNIVLRDKVMPVRLAALELFTDTFAKTEGVVSQDEAHLALGVLIEHLIDRLGDSNLRLHEGARKGVLFCAERTGLLGLTVVLQRLYARLEATSAGGKGGERAKVHFGILDAVNVLVQHFPGRRNEKHAGDDEEDLDDWADGGHSPEDSWTQHDTASFIVAGMDDTLGPRVRNSAVALAVTVYQTFGMEAMAPVLAELRPALQAVLKQKFQESEDGFGDLDGEEDGGDGGATAGDLMTPDLSGLVICGQSIRAPACMPPLPGAVGTDNDEEFLMDGILEDAGAVFAGTGMVVGGGAACAAMQDGVNLDVLEDEYQSLEEELLRMGLELDGIDEQQALLNSLQADDMDQLGMSVEVF